MLPDLSAASWPAGMRVIVRRERPHPGAQLTFTDIDGWRFQAFATDTPTEQLGWTQTMLGPCITTPTPTPTG